MDDTATRFTEMAQRLEKNKGEQFGGAFVIVPPAEGGEPVSTVIFDNRQDPAQFWNLVLTRAQIMLGDLEQKQRAGQAFGRR